MSHYLGDFAVGDVIIADFTTVDSTGAPAALTSGSVGCYVSNSATETYSGITLTASFDSLTGYNLVHLTTASNGTFFATANDFRLVLRAGSVGSVNVAGYTIAQFSLENRIVNWAKVTSKTTAVNLTATSIGGTVNATTLGINQAGVTVGTVTSVTNRVTANTDQLNGSAIQQSGGFATVNVTSIGGAAVSTSVAQVGVNVVNVGGSAVQQSGGFLSVNATSIGGVAPGSATIGTATNVTNRVTANTDQLNGSAIQQSGGFATVNVTSVGGSAVQQSGGFLSVNATSIGGVAPGSATIGTVTTATTATTVTSIGANGISSASLQATAGEEIADAVLGRNVAGGGNGTRTVTEALQRLRNRTAVVASTGTVYAADDSTISWQFIVTTTGAVSISDVNPT